MGAPVLMDVEAGIEHLGRGTGNSYVAVLMAVDPSYGSLKLSEKIAELCAKVGCPLYYVLNKVTPKNEAAMAAKIGAPEKILYKLSLSEEQVNAGLSGDTLERRFEEIQKLIAALG